MGRKEINPHGGKVYLFLDNLGKTATVHKTRAVSAPYPIPLSTTQDIFHLQFPYPPPEDKAIDLQWMSWSFGISKKLVVVKLLSLIHNEAGALR